MKDRIRQIIDTEGLSQSEFAERIGVQRSNISHILSGRNNPSIDFIQKLLSNFPNINSEWVLLGKGKMYKEETETPDKEPIKKNIHIENKDNQQKINYNTPKKENIPIENLENKSITETIFANPEQVLVLFDDQTFITYKKR